MTGEAERSFGQALVFRRCLFALRTVGVEVRLAVFGSSFHLDAASEAQTAWLHIAFCSGFFRSFRISKQQEQQQQLQEQQHQQEGEEALPFPPPAKEDAEAPVLCITLPIKHLWRILTKAGVPRP